MFKNSTNHKEIQFINKMNQVADQLRKRPTIAEDYLWKYLRKNRLLGYKFRRQFAIDKYIVDFICCDQKIIIEVDGPIHQQSVEYDRQRDLYLQLRGYNTIRFSNAQVFNKTKFVLDAIASLLQK